MKAKILGLLAVVPLAGPVAANAGYMYTFSDAQLNPTFSLSFTVPDFITTAGVLSVTPISAGGITFTQARTNLYLNGICFEFGDSNANLFAANNGCGFPGSSGDGFAQVYLSTPASIGSFSSDFGAGNIPHVSYLTVSSAAVPEPGTLALLGLGLAGLGLSRRRIA